VRFDINSQFFDNSSESLYEELKRKGLGADEQEFTDLISSTMDVKGVRFLTFNLIG
jgi:hypothetical protein